MTRQLLHQRSQIRLFVRDMLQAALPELAKNIFANRYKPLWSEEDIPAIIIYTRADNGSIFDQAPRRYKRELQLVVEIIVAGNEHTDDSIDELCKRVEDIFFVNDTLGALVSDAEMGNTEMDINVEGEFIFASAKMVWNVIYFTDAPGIEEVDALPTLNQINLQIKAPVGADQGTTGVAEIDSVVNIPE